MLNSNTRKGPGYAWSEETNGPCGLRQSSGFTIDNLDTKSFEEAISKYERLFISVRDFLGEKYADSLTAEQRLQCTQDISDMLRERGLIAKEG